MSAPAADLATTLRTLPNVDHRARIDRLRSLLPPAGVDALLITHLTNVRHLTGFTGSAGLLVVTTDGVVFVTDGRYDAQAAQQVGGADIGARIEITSTEQRRIVADAVGGTGTVGLEAEHVSWAAQRRYAEDWFPGRELVPTSGLVEELRLVKDDAELARMGAAAAVADAALASVRHRLLEGPTEAEFGLELDTAMRRLGASRPSFETIVASGPNGALPHARPSDRRIGEGDLVVLDFGAVVDGYCSDMTRTLMVGEPTEVQARMLAVVTEAQAAGVAAVAAGVAASEVDAACRGVIAAAGWADAFTHGTGHGVGLDIHEAPRVAGSSDATLDAGQVVTVEPGVYLPEHGGVRVEDSLVVTTDGNRPLTLTPKLTAP
ncbi:M24 family metallopeptidase [Rhabdothermincola salaria]|uniref:M24 family metallopeptidase n=1 Tax=Rhabdothermincola salaria TaxID=2903142 RepID=UPI001E515C77|nr:Xaa-Pro peptidase family protein [Rhabdothermincola salaria]MCD9623201.1 Xaa-Pro peptidase family protein [Rhabdothermincola salaria]